MIDMTRQEKLWNFIADELNVDDSTIMLAIQLKGNTEETANEVIKFYTGFNSKEEYENALFEKNNTPMTIEVHFETKEIITVDAKYKKLLLEYYDDEDEEYLDELRKELIEELEKKYNLPVLHIYGGNRLDEPIYDYDDL